MESWKKDLERKSMTLLSDKIPCRITIFSEFDIIKKSLEFYTKYSDRLLITVIENRSDNTEGLIKPYVLDLLKQGKICKYILFDKNISSNASVMVFRQNLFEMTNSPYVIATEGDLICEDEHWLDEEISILEQNPEVFVVGMDMSLENLPKVKNAENWVPPAIPVEDKNYQLGNTGGWCLLYRKDDYKKIFKHIVIQKNSVPIDSEQGKYCNNMGKIWTRTKKAKVYHLTWDIYKNPEHPYTKMKRKMGFSKIWLQKKYCGYRIYQKDDKGVVFEKKVRIIPFIYRIMTQLTRLFYVIRRLRIIWKVKAC